MPNLDEFFKRNQEWAARKKAEDPNFFARLANQQKPRYLWIGCSDSRVPANQISGLAPGEIFVHRNIANIVVHTDFNCLSVIQFAVEMLQVEHIIVCGHYGCSGVLAAMGASQLGLIDNWLRHIKDVYSKHESRLLKLQDDDERHNKLCELNVIEQVQNVCHTTIVQQAWQNDQLLSVHGWIYGVSDGLLKDLKVTVSGTEEISNIYKVDSEGPF